MAYQPPPPPRPPTPPSPEMDKEELKKIFADVDAPRKKPAEADIFGRAASWGEDSD